MFVDSEYDLRKGMSPAGKTHYDDRGSTARSPVEQYSGIKGSDIKMVQSTYRGEEESGSGGRGVTYGTIGGEKLSTSGYSE